MLVPPKSLGELLLDLFIGSWLGWSRILIKLKKHVKTLYHSIFIFLVFSSAYSDTKIGRVAWRLLGEEVQERLLEAVRKDKELSQSKSGGAGKTTERKYDEKETTPTMARHEISVAENFAFVRALNPSKASRLLEQVALPLSLTAGGPKTTENTVTVFKNGVVPRRFQKDHKALAVVVTCTPESINEYLSAPFHLVDRPRLIHQPSGVFSDFLLLDTCLSGSITCGALLSPLRFTCSCF